MAFLPLAGLSISSVAGGAAALIGAVGSVAQGYATQQAMNYNAKVLQIQAKTAEDQAASQAGQEVDKTRREVAKAQAAGVEGGLDFSGSFRDVIASGDAEGHLNALNAIYKGNVLATGYRNQAAADIYMGKTAMTAGYIGAGTNLLKGVATVYKGGSLDL